MSLKPFALAAALAVLTLPAIADDMTITIKDGYARSGPKSGAAFFIIVNDGDADDTLIAARSDVAKRVELHTHLEDDNGVMRMREIEDGIVVPAGGMHALERGGDHVMFMGLDAPMDNGTTVSVTLTFQKAGDLVLELPVDNARKPKHGGHGSHSGHGS